MYCGNLGDRVAATRGYRVKSGGVTVKPRIVESSASSLGRVLGGCAWLDACLRKLPQVKLKVPSGRYARDHPSPTDSRPMTSTPAAVRLRLPQLLCFLCILSRDDNELHAY